MATKFFKCKNSDNIAIKLVDSATTCTCCDDSWVELVANTVDASQEKHVHVVTKVDDNTIRVDVGSIEHPMAPDHHISFIYVETENGGMLKYLKDKPVASFFVGNDKPIAVYEYCNLHGLWKTIL